MPNPLADALTKLKPSGAGGFEGLIAKLLEKLTKRRFFLAGGGDQHGRDISSDHRLESVIAVECKRYRKKTGFKERELLGELLQADRTIPALDLWILVTSREVGSKLYESLKAAGERLGFEIDFISTNDDEADALECTLLPLLPDTVDEYFEDILEDQQRVEVRHWLGEVAKATDYQRQLELLRSEFKQEVIGYANWREGQNGWLLSRLHSQRTAHATFRQKLNILDDSVCLIARQDALRELDDWFEKWGKTKSPLVLLGEEGGRQDMDCCLLASKSNQKR